MYKQAFSALSLSLGFALALSNCGPTCPPGEQNCTTSNASAGAGGDAGATTCDLLTAVQSCMSAYCATTSNPFCTCFQRKYDIDTTSCMCIPLDAKSICDQESRGVDAASYDCAAESSRVSSICVTVN
ncbi:MAG: hypothetical protein WDO69_23830 [Pseudomonadota bacterium]